MYILFCLDESRKEIILHQEGGSEEIHKRLKDVFLVIYVPLIALLLCRVKSNARDYCVAFGPFYPRMMTWKLFLIL